MERRRCLRKAQPEQRRRRGAVFCRDYQTARSVVWRRRKPRKPGGAERAYRQRHASTGHRLKPQTGGNAGVRSYGTKTIGPGQREILASPCQGEVAVAKLAKRAGPRQSCIVCTSAGKFMRSPFCVHLLRMCRLSLAEGAQRKCCRLDIVEFTGFSENTGFCFFTDNNGRYANRRGLKQVSAYFF